MGIKEILKITKRHKDARRLLKPQCLCVYIFLSVSILVTSCKTQQPVATNVPVKVTVDTTQKNVAVKDSVVVPKQKVFHISLLLPLSLDKQFETDSAGNEIDILPSSLQALHFYEGFILAVDTSKDKKIQIQYSVYDTDRDSISLWKLLNSETVVKSDLVMAMLPASWNTIAAKISSIRNYQLFLLQGNNTNCLTANEKTFLISPNNSTQCKLMAAYLNDIYPGSNAIIISRENNKKETDLANLFYAEIDSLSNHISVVKSKGDFNIVKSKLNKTKQNVLIIPSSDESYLSALISKLSELKEYKIAIGGLPTWEYFESIDPALLETLNTYIFSTSYIDYKKENVKKFRKQFIENYHADPPYAAFQAYDLLQWVQSNTAKSASDLDKFVSPSALTINGIKPLKICDNCGFENSSISVLKFKDGLLEKVNH